MILRNFLDRIKMNRADVTTRDETKTKAKVESLTVEEKFDRMDELDVCRQPWPPTGDALLSYFYR